MAIDDWIDLAECGTADPRLFEVETTSPKRMNGEYSQSERMAVSYCVRCPVRLACLQACLRDKATVRFGVWGGTRPHDRLDPALRGLSIQEQMVALERRFRSELTERAVGRGVYVSEGAERLSLS